MLKVLVKPEVATQRCYELIGSSGCLCSTKRADMQGSSISQY